MSGPEHDAEAVAARVAFLEALPPHLRAALEAGAEALAPAVEGCVDCAMSLAGRVLDAALPHLETHYSGPAKRAKRNGKGK